MRGVDHSRHHVYLGIKDALPTRYFKNLTRHEIKQCKMFYRLVLVIYSLKATIFTRNCRFDTRNFNNFILNFFKVEISFEISYIFKFVVLLKSFL